MKTVLGIELGSTRIKSVLIDGNGVVLAQGSYEWENELVDGLWSYSLEKAELGLQTSYANLIKNYGKPITKVDAIGISAMMHGYLAFDKNYNLLAPFRTWRNVNTNKAASELSTLFNFNVPMRWSVSQYYQSVLDNLSHVPNIAFLTTLSGYVHYKLTGEKALGVNDASGMFPLNELDYDKAMLSKFNSLLKSKGLSVNFQDLLPKVIPAGEVAGVLTKEGAKWLDVSGNLQSGIILCAPEGDMGTGMVATNSVTVNTGNVSAGTSGNLTVILDKPLKNYYKEIDVIATPDGHPAALIHANNCTTEINEWVGIFNEVLSLFGVNANKGELYNKLFTASLNSNEETGKVISYNFLASEPLAGTTKGAPTVIRSPSGEMNLANFMQSQIYSAIVALKLGLSILEKEGVKIKSVIGHGGYYKTQFVGQNATSAILETPVTVMETAAEGGAWGMALLALYATDNSLSLTEFLANLFKNVKQSTVMATESEILKARKFYEDYVKGLPVADSASNVF